MSLPESQKWAEKQGSMDGIEWFPVATQYANKVFVSYKDITYKFYRMVFFSVTGETCTVSMDWKHSKPN
jgi:hypothetical protein